MDRRRFIATSFASLAYCGCPRRTSANPSDRGCSLTAGRLAEVQQTMKPASGVGLAGLEKEIFSDIVSLRERYGLRPGATFIDDSTDDPNAYAVPDVLVPSGDWGGGDGTVLLGKNLFFQQFRDSAVDVLHRAPYEQRVLDEHALNSLVIIAHEFGHILQFKNGLASDTAWQVEPHADFMAGWAIDRNWVNALFGNQEKSFENAVRLMFSLGDTQFNNPKHHGEPQFRAAMVRAGQDAHDLPLQAAFEKGAKLVGLKI
jgi:hypothetical protein